MQWVSDVHLGLLYYLLKMVPTCLIHHGSLSVQSHSISRTNACFGLVNNSAISDHSCLGDGTCTMPFGEIKPYAALIVESGSCKSLLALFRFEVLTVMV